MILRHHILIGFVLLFLFLTPLAQAQPEPVAPTDQAQTETPAFPGLSELGPRSSMLTDFTEKSENSLKLLSTLETAEKNLVTFSIQYQELRDKAALLGNPNEWYIDRLTQFYNQFLQLKKNLEDLQTRMTERQKEVELIIAKSRKEQEFWQQWAKELKAQKVVIPVKTVNQVKSLLESLAKTEKSTTSAILKVQEKIGTLQQKVSSDLDQFASALVALRQATFRKNSHSFFSLSFWSQFNEQLWKDTTQGWKTKTLDSGYLQRYVWVFGLLLPGLLLSFAIRKYSHPLQENQEWQFVTTHPFAAGGFITILLMSNVFPAPPAQLSFGLMVGGVIAVSILASKLVENRRQAYMLYLAGLVLVITTGFRLINLPQPLYRIHIAFLALVTIPILFSQIKSSRRERDEKAGRFFRSLLRFAITVLLIALIAQIAGFMNFSSWLLQATFETGMVFLFAHMILRLGSGGISFVLQQTPLSQWKFAKRFAKELAQRLTRTLQILVVVYSIFYLLPLWRLFASSREAWEIIHGYSLTLGATTISVEMITLALGTLYLTFQMSWLLQAIFETRFFYKKAVDRGVRDAIKKLMHYGVVTIGFLAVLSTLGLSLQNFVVVLGALGVGIGFGLQDIVNNFLSGLILLFERPVKVGDFIIVNEEWGTISKIGLRSTVVETIDRSEIIVPNSQLISEKVTNWTFSSQVARLLIPVGVAYGSNVTQVMEILTTVAQKHPEALQDPAPNILFMNFGDSSLNFEIRVFINDIRVLFRIRSEMLQQIDVGFREAGIEIPFPQRDLHLRSIDEKVMEQMLKDSPTEKD